MRSFVSKHFAQFRCDVKANGVYSVIGFTVSSFLLSPIKLLIIYLVTALLSHFLNEESLVLMKTIPYFLERVIFHTFQGIIRSISMVSAINTANSSVASSPEPVYKMLHLNRLSAGSPKQMPSTSEMRRSNNLILFQQFWNLLKVIREFPIDYLENVSHLLGTGLYLIVKFAYHYEVDITLEQWFIYFSLLSQLTFIAADSNGLGQTAATPRQLEVLKILQFMVDNHMIQMSNLSLCRSLLVKIVQR